jgi:hypothetical protein
MLQQQATFGMQEEAFRSRMNQLRINQPIQQASLLSAGLTGVQTALGTAQAMHGLDFKFPGLPSFTPKPAATSTGLSGATLYGREALIPPLDGDLPN